MLVTESDIQKNLEFSPLMYCVTLLNLSSSMLLNVKDSPATKLWKAFCAPFCHIIGASAITLLSNYRFLTTVIQLQYYYSTVIINAITNTKLQNYRDFNLGKYLSHNFPYRHCLIHIFFSDYGPDHFVHLSFVHFCNSSHVYNGVHYLFSYFFVNTGCIWCKYWYNQRWQQSISIINFQMLTRDSRKPV